MNISGATPIRTIRSSNNGISAFELDQKDFKPIKWAVPNVIPEGVTILAGKPKIGKSWLILNCAIAVATGGKALGSIDCVKGKVLYAANEDNERRLQKRGRTLLPQGEMPQELIYLTNNNLSRLNEGGIEQIKEWLETNTDARLVIIDTLASVKPIKNGGEQFLSDYEVGSMLQALASEHNIAIVVVHHTRKSDSNDAVDEISGTLGLVAGFDGFLTLKRTPQKECDGVLYVDGRDIEHPGEYALKWDADCALWTLLGDAFEYNTTSERKKIKDAIMNNGSAMDAYALSETLGKNRQAISKTCERMIEDGEMLKTKKDGERKTFYTLAKPGGGI